ncbi:MAG: DUF1365 domain-containing protein [Sphingomonadaceae bacterium]
MLPESNSVQLCVGQVRHKRMRPLTHAFDYGVYFLRLPLRSLGHKDFGTRLMSRNRFNLLSFYDRDHGDGRQPLQDWITGLLLQQGVQDADGEIWLQTMPRVLGYVFNPVSFWFCHRADGSLRAVLCDVRNTFGERHYYLLDDGGTIANGQLLQASKRFHVSPFFGVDGGYRFRFVRGGAGDRYLTCIDYHDDHGTLLSTSLSGTARPLSDAGLLRACMAHPLLTFGVMLKIHWQALQLWLRRVPFFSKPAPPAHEIN